MQYFLSYITKCARTRNCNITCLNFIHFSRKSSYLTDKSFLMRNKKERGDGGRKFILSSTILSLELE